MPFIINSINAALDETEDKVLRRALQRLGSHRDKVAQSSIHKVSLDARKRKEIHYVYSVYVCLDDEKLERSLCRRNKDFSPVAASELKPVISTNKVQGRVVITGFGPAGMFCALALAEQGYKPLVIERGERVEQRTKTVKSFWTGGELDEQSNVQFGEGGAGTFSDGKLTTRINDPLCRYVLEKLVQLGAPEEICTRAKPHIGTDKLRLVVKNIRERIISLGGEIRFCERLEDITIANAKAQRITTTRSTEQTAALVLALGHSARDTFEMLARKGIFMQPKAFSVGARIEHLQKDVEKSLYGDLAGSDVLPRGEYQLSFRENGRGVYTFCMCPGGTVVPAASERGGVVTNGMSEFARDGENANAALVVGVTPQDFGNDPLDGVVFAKSIEQAAFRATGSYKAPATTVRGFLSGKPDLDTNIVPTYSRGIVACDISKLYPESVSRMMKLGLEQFSRKMACFGDENAVLTAPETRTSSPVRITRNESLTAPGVDNLYPCGEGAGYAGGIMSAAVDGLRVALQIMSTMAPCENS
ncbi:FAD-dependent protein [Ruminococcus sp. FC2018]|uniref:NAD(P)/FAD-dependent oxidoreductase n=1 Tax=Ruminococcus sp. FC2018 TaxID=1410617 RepID=UPI000490E08C|nr:NAD(P)/FAD-dependent oxidoreductase [Ruminococcus sp. FC2018]